MVYFAMLIVALVSVVMGLEVVTAPPPMKTATKPALVEPIRHVAPATPARPAVAQEAAVPAPPAEPRQTVSQSPGGEQASAQASDPAPACNIQACEEAYRSFTASDCTYQPFDGPRRLCTK